MVNNVEFSRGIDVVQKDFIKLLTQRVSTATEYLKGQAVKNTPSDTGVLRNSFITQVKVDKDRIVGKVGNTSQYAAYVHQGTGIYVPGGRKTKWKYFVATGKYKGWHTTNGQKPNPFLLRARDKSIEDIKKLLGVD